MKCDETKLASDGQEKSQTEQLLRLAQGAHLFHSPEQEGYVAVQVRKHQEVHRINSDAFRQFLRSEFFRRTGKGANEEALRSAVATLEAQARFVGPEQPVFVRLAWHNGDILLDLGNETWQAIKITKNGWQHVNEPPVRFRRPAGMLPLPHPERGGSIDQLRPFVNADEDGFVLTSGWLIGALRPSGPYPMLEFQGEQGTAKSTLCKVLRGLVDPNASALRAKPRDERDLMIAANNGWVLAFDNLSGLSDQLSDGFCRLLTGAGFGTRLLYSDDAEKLFHACRPFLVNGIDNVATRSDLLDRSIVVTLLPITDDRRRKEEQLWADYHAAAPGILGALLDASVMALKRSGTFTLKQLPRLADFASWVTAAEAAFGWRPGTFLAAYRRNRERANRVVVENDALARTIRDYLSTGDGFAGTATELIGDLRIYARDQPVPTTPEALGRRLRRMAPNLRLEGIEIAFDEREGHEGRRVIRIRRAAKGAVSTVSGVGSDDKAA